MEDAALLEVRDVIKDFPGVRALDGVNLKIQPGEIHALLGENGAGKTTLVNILTGVYQPDVGTVLVGGAPVALSSPRAAARLGVGVIHQDLRLAPHLSVGVNINLDNIPVRRGLAGRLFQILDREAIRGRAAVALAAVGNPVPPTVAAGRLSVAQAQLVQIGRALSGRLTALLLDEPTSSLSPMERDELFTHLRRLVQGGIGILYISHRLDEIVEIADRATVMRDGRVIGCVDRADISVDRVAAMMLGTSKIQPIFRASSSARDIVLELRGLTREPAFRDVDLRVRSGEIVGLTGLVGAGRTEVARCVFGADRPDRGEIYLNGHLVRPQSPREAIALGIGFVAEDRKTQGVFGSRSLHDNLILSSLARPRISSMLVRSGQWIRRTVTTALAQRTAQRMRIRPLATGTLVGTMSGGNQQKVLLGRWLCTDVPLLLLDEPTRGVDVGAKAEIWTLIRELAADGIGILAISSEVPELLTYADRIVVMKGGRIAGEAFATTTTEAEVMLLAGGAN